MDKKDDGFGDKPACGPDVQDNDDNPDDVITTLASDLESMQDDNDFQFTLFEVPCVSNEQ